MVAVGWLGTACGDDLPDQMPGSSGPPGTTGDATTTTGIDPDESGDRPGTDSSTGEEPEPLPDPPPVAPFFEPEPLPVDAWRVASADDSSDSVLEAIDADVFALPPLGEAYGVVWDDLVPGRNGELTTTSDDSLYAAAQLEAPDGRFVFCRDDTVRGMYTNNGNLQPGDVYASGRIRVPLAMGSEPSLVVARAYGRRGVPQVQLFSTPDELVFNLADLTLPAYPVGDSSVQYVGAPILNNTDRDTRHIRAHVIENDYFEDTVIEYVGLPATSVSQIAFELRPKAAFEEAGQEVPAILRIEPLWFDWSYEREVTVQTVEPDAVYRRTRRSEVDGSVQFYGVRPPTEPAPADGHGMILSLHGAGVGGQGQAAAYSAKSWAYLVAPTNRRPFGFDWEEWGRLDALEALDHAEAFFGTDPTRTHVTGHSMGGHGTWHVGVHFPDRFSMVGPSAGWISFSTYGSLLIPEGVLGAARAASKTMDYIDNFALSPVHIIHGLADTNVPSFQAQTMFDALGPIAPELWYHAEPGAGHWWDLDPEEPGADCVDWEPMMALMEERTVDPYPLDFHFVSAGPWVNPQRSYVRILSEQTPLEHPELDSSLAGDALTLTTTNVRSLEIDAALLRALGVGSLTVDGMAVSLDDTDTVTVGPDGGKTPSVHGPLNQVFHRPVCFVYPEDGPNEYREYAAYLASSWSVRGNGQAQAIPFERLTGTIEDEYNIIYLGVPTDDIVDLPESLSFEVGEDAITFGGQDFTQSAIAFVFPAATGRLSAVWATVPGFEFLLFRTMPFTSRSGLPDYTIWRANNGNRVGGFFDAEWTLDPALAEVF